MDYNPHDAHHQPRVKNVKDDQCNCAYA
jgi:hypothetical protein